MFYGYFTAMHCCCNGPLYSFFYSHCFLNILNNTNQSECVVLFSTRYFPKGNTMANTKMPSLFFDIYMFREVSINSLMHGWLAWQIWTLVDMMWVKSLHLHMHPRIVKKQFAHNTSFC